MAYEWHRKLEVHQLTLTVLAFVAVVIGGLVLLIPPYFLQGTIQPVGGLRVYSALELEGRDLYIREGCNTCHSQQVRPLLTETERYGHYSVAGEGIYDRPFLWGSRRTGPDLARVGGKYPDSWHWIHLRNPREIEPRSNMPAFAFLSESRLDTSLTRRKLEVLRGLGHPYSDADVENAVADVERDSAAVADRLRKDGITLDDEQAHSETIALIAYLQRLGRGLEWPATPAPETTATAAPAVASGGGR
jgi:cytochrome c oxidase cbb3-type subunit I/II